MRLRHARPRDDAGSVARRVAGDDARKPQVRGGLLHTRATDHRGDRITPPPILIDRNRKALCTSSHGASKLVRPRPC